MQKHFGKTGYVSLMVIITTSKFCFYENYGSESARCKSQLECNASNELVVR